MTKLEEKLDKLNYYIDRSDSGTKTFCYTKIFPHWVQIYIYYNSEIDKITDLIIVLAFVCGGGGISDTEPAAENGTCGSPVYPFSHHTSVLLRWPSCVGK